MYADSETIRRILTGTGDTWAVVGLSSNTARAAHGVAGVLQRYGKRVVPVHPKAETVHGERGYASLEEIPFPVDVVDVFVNSDPVTRIAVLGCCGASDDELRAGLVAARGGALR
ncbi:CoA-binding protein, partial [Streptomyces sp. NPDC048845]|uniref:CoA-binding protein n=1 Tax=Streptomyces sp. NPDC048845 TaxID=3155390 RepID=UPI00341C929C